MMKKGNRGFANTINIGILVFDDFEPIDVWGFIEAFSIARFIGTNYSAPVKFPFSISFIANQNSPQTKNSSPILVRSYNGPRVVADYFRDEALKQDFDLLMIPGGQGVRTILSSIDQYNPNANSKPTPELEELLTWVRAMDKRVPIMSSVCTGAAILASAGVLNGRAAATNHQAFAWVTAFGPKVLWNNVSRWVDDGKYVTSAGVSAGTDMAFHLVSRLAGRAVAEAAAIAAEYDWHRDPNQPIFYPEQAAVPGTLPQSK